MTSADVDCNQERGEVKEQLEDGDPATSIEVHGSGVQCVYPTKAGQVQ